MQTAWQNPLLLITGISGMAFFIAGLLLWKYPPRHPNFLYGYRTRRSMHSQEAWEFSQPYAGRKLMHTGLLLTGIGLLSLLFPEMHQGVAVLISMLLLVVVPVITLLQTEKALKEKFGR